MTTKDLMQMDNETAAKKFRSYYMRGIIRSLLMIVIAVAVIAILPKIVPDIYVGSAGSLVTILFLILMAMVFKLQLNHQKKAMRLLVNMLVDECDPRKYIAISEILGQRYPFKKSYRGVMGITCSSALIIIGEYDKAFNMLRNIYNNSTDMNVRCAAIYNNSIAQYKTGDYSGYADSVRLFKQIKSSLPPKIIEKMNYASFEMGTDYRTALIEKRYEDALDLFEKAESMSNVSRYAQIHYYARKGEIYYLMGDYQKAIDLFEQCIEIAGDARLVAVDEAKEMLAEAREKLESGEKLESEEAIETKEE